MLCQGDPAPDFRAASNVNPNFHFDTIAGRYVVLSFFASTAHPYSQRLIEEIYQRRERFDQTNAIFFGVSIDPADQQRVPQDWAGIKYVWDFDQAISRLYGLSAPVQSPDPASGAAPSQQIAYQPRSFVLDQALRVLEVIPFNEDPLSHANRICQALDAQPSIREVNLPAPVLLVPGVFERELCRRLIDYYETNGGEDSGFMRDVGGKTVAVLDYSHKRRSDCEIRDETLIRATQERLVRRVVPAIRQAFQFNANRIERHIVACYDASEGGHFRAHRDNTTLGTAHRRFAVTMNLNAEEFEGGELWLPEFGPRKYRAPTGGAVIFSCSLLHEATPVTAGKRYAFLPFLYDNAAAQIRERNRQFLATAPPSQDAQTQSAPMPGVGG